MNWNIRRMSHDKLNIPGMAAAIANTVAGQNIDVLIVIEVTMTNVAAALTVLSNALNAANGGGNNWRACFLSFRTGAEYYGILIRDLNLIRPGVVINGPPGVMPDDWGSRFAPLADLREYTFRVWPTPDFAVDAYAAMAALGPVRPSVPLTTVYASPVRNRAAKKQKYYAGQSAAEGGYSEGRGYRIPMLLLLWVHTPAPINGDYLVPVVVCHYAAAGYQARQQTMLARAQIGQLKELHIAQMFNSNPLGAGASGYLDFVDAAGAHFPVAVQELCFTGDFNVDFLVNAAFGNNDQQANRYAYNTVTPTPQLGGSMMGPGTPGVPAVPPPAVPYVPPFLPGPETGTIPPQRLHAAATSQGTILRRYPVPVPPPLGPPPAPWVSASFDNFIYGGTQLNTAVVGFGVFNMDSAEVVNAPANVVTPGAPLPLGPSQYDAGPIAAHYAAAGTWNAAAQPNLQAAAVPPPVLTDDDRLVGANIVSDHIPVVLDFNCP